MFSVLRRPPEIAKSPAEISVSGGAARRSRMRHSRRNSAS
jgi:hypothetical protein